MTSETVSPMVHETNLETVREEAAPPPPPPPVLGREAKVGGVPEALQHVGAQHADIQQALKPILANQSQMQVELARTKAAWALAESKEGSLQRPSALCSAYGCCAPDCPQRGKKHIHEPRGVRWRTGTRGGSATRAATVACQLWLGPMSDWECEHPSLE